MTSQTVQVRRATIDDLPKLVALWRLEHLPAQHLETRFKEFQVVEGAGGELLGAMGLQVAGQEGLVHSEAFARFDQADALRAQLFERIRTVAINHGLVRLWTQFSTPFWRTTPFEPAPAELLSRLPSGFAGGSQPWLFIKLREEPPPASMLDKEFALFQEAERESTQRMLRRARIARAIAMTTVVVVFGLIAVLMIVFMRTRR
ncbi:MAG TPA: hypothetical protein VNO52_18500 [Methylomirabilota bacterium]|nr:hypothetical protein [Methylomirabilota bacterium]